MAQYQLNVVLHGTWGIENNQDAIRIVTIDHHHHVIKAGGREDPKYDLKKKKEYRLRGVTKGDPQNFNADQNPTVDAKIDFPDEPDRQFHADTTAVKVVIDLDYPQEIHSVRRFATNGEKFFRPPIPRTPLEMAEVQVLVYDVKDLKALRLEGSDWTPELNSDNRTINLHLFAEPDKVMVGDILEEEDKYPGNEKHFVEVYKKLGKAFGLTMTPLNMTDEPPVLEEEIAGLDKYDTIALFERRNRAAGSPVNCAMVVLNNLKRLSST